MTVLGSSSILDFKIYWICLFSYSNNGLIISYRFHEIDSFLDKVLHLGFKPTVVTYNTLMHGMYTLGLWTNAKEMFKEMLINNITPDVYTMIILINAFVKCKDFDKALGVIQEMSLKGLTPNLITYNIMIDALCKENKLAFVNHLIEVMKAYGLKPDVVIWSSLLHGLCENGQLDEAMGLIGKMENKGVSLNIVTYSILIDGLCEVGQLRKAVDVFLSLPSKRLKPNLHTYTIMIKGLCKAGLFDDACELFKTMEDDGYTADAYAINTLVIEFLNRNYPSKASGVVKCRNDIQFKANVTSLFEGLLNRDDVSYAQKEMIVQILRSKQLPHVVTVQISSLSNIFMILSLRQQIGQYSSKYLAESCESLGKWNLNAVSHHYMGIFYLQSSLNIPKQGRKHDISLYMATFTMLELETDVSCWH
ncbi:pentatricopeptide repeat-containing protein At3g22470, mitochondrial-like [Amaranthus tricolor]|uniref:pentatricopeptide repeat-containing protein At3g22470, mitochondrial-like n=1 Tax=Amaranthus tricolor TaxID=29722 RepID=UPI0025852669|nr:pentatricopeptide repeat-containing protein At3g22470, mitochondrial-like [Amaranthus tricolor]